MDCTTGLQVADVSTIGRITLISLLALGGMIMGALAVEMISRKQAEENKKYIDYLKTTIDKLVAKLNDE